MEEFLEALKRQEEERKGGSTRSIESSFAPPNISVGSHDTGDPTTTNLYVGNLNPHATEPVLCYYFGKYGDIASVKIMWPRTQEERDRGRNCGFVSYMRRAEAEVAVKEMDGFEIMGFLAKVGWGKAVPLPAAPIYVKNQAELPVVPTNHPFNAQMLPLKSVVELTSAPTPASILQPTAKVVIPTDIEIRNLIHRMVERVVKYGPEFEAAVMEKEWGNNKFKWLWVNSDPHHIYYRWKIYSLLNNDTATNWRTEPFKMFDDVVVWVPPEIPFEWGSRNDSTCHIPPTDSDLEGEKDSFTASSSSNMLSGSADRTTFNNKVKKRFEVLLRQITAKRKDIERCMCLAIGNGELATEIIDILTTSLTQFDTSLPTKLARLYLLSDILYNCGANVPSAWKYRTAIETKLPLIFENLNKVYIEIEARLKAEGFRRCVVNTLSAWSSWMVFPEVFLDQLRELFLRSKEESALSNGSGSVGVKVDEDRLSTDIGIEVGPEGEAKKRRKVLSVKSKWDEENE